MIKHIAMLGLLTATLSLFGCTTPDGGGGSATGGGKKAKVKLDPIDSKIFQGAKYDGESKVLTLQFNNGGTYRYADVPAAVHQKFLAAEDKGQFFLEEIKDKYTGSYVFD